MYLIKAKKQSIEEILKKYYEKDLDDLPYEAFEELEKKQGSVLYEARMNVFAGIEGSLSYANEKYVYLTKEHYELISKHCKEQIARYQSEGNSKCEWEHNWHKNLLCWLQDASPNWEEDVVVYEHDC